MKATFPVGVQPGTKLVQLSYEGGGVWLLWIHHDRLMQHGTYLKLYSDGAIERITVSLDGTEDIVKVR